MNISGAHWSERTAVQGLVVIHVRGDVEMREMFRIKEMIGSLHWAGQSRVILSLGQVDHVNYMSIGILVEQLRLLRNLNGDLKLAGMSSYVRAIFCAFGMDQLFEIYASVEEALESFSEDWSGEHSSGVLQ